MNKAFKKPLFKWHLSKYYKAWFKYNRNVTYSKWLSMQPKSIVKSIYGKTSADIWNNLDGRCSEFIGNKSNKQFEGFRGKLIAPRHIDCKLSCVEFGQLINSIKGG